MGYTLEQPQAVEIDGIVGMVGIVGLVGIVRVVGISLSTKRSAIRSFMWLVVIIEAHDVLWKFCIL